MSGPKWSVPYITMRAGEEAVPESMLRIRYSPRGTPTGLCYEMETPPDRDDRGVLWTRTSQSRSPDSGRPVGRPLFAAVHPSRQREMMTALRCQACGRPASHTEAGYLFLETAGHGRAEGLLTGHPPVCLDHALAGIETCRHLSSKGFVLLRSRVPRLYGILGQAFTAVNHVLEPLPPLIGPDGEDVPVPYTRRDLTPWVAASQLVRRLTGVTVVEDIDRELAAARRPAPPADGAQHRPAVVP